MQVSRTYVSGQQVQLEVELTAYHAGYFEFRLCPLNTEARPVPQACLDRWLLSSEEGQRYRPAPPPAGQGVYRVPVQLPPGLTCQLCVLQWRYTAANSWGDCGNETGAVGCGPQEEFRACSDIRVEDSQGRASGEPNTEPGNTVLQPWVGDQS